MSNVDKRETTMPLSIAVLGVGRIGSTFAYKLAAAGHDVTVVTRPGSERLRQLQRDHGIRLKSGGRSDVRIADALDENIAYDLVLVTTLDHQVDALLPTLQRSEARCIQFMFVTFNAERFAGAIGDERCRFGMPAVTASLDAEGKLDAAVPRQKTLHSDQRWVDLFNRAGMPSELERNMPLWLRCHVPLTVAMESVSVAGRQHGGGASWAEAKTVARGLAGGFAVIRDLGDRLYPRSKSWLNSAPTFVVTLMLWAVSHIASFRELLADGAPEARALVDTMAAAGAGTKPALAPAVRDLLAMRPAADPA